jgi:hypothetical protein
VAEIFTGDPVFEDTPATVLARVCARVASGALSPIQTEGYLIKQTDIASIACKVYEEEGTLIIATTPSKTDVIYDTLQTIGVFAKLLRGGNFAYDIPATAFPSGSVNVRVEITITLTSGEPVRMIWEFPVLPLVQS